MLFRTVLLFSESKTVEIASVAISCRLTYSVLSMNLAPGTPGDRLITTGDWSRYSLFFFVGGYLRLSPNLVENKRTVYSICMF